MFPEEMHLQHLEKRTQQFDGPVRNQDSRAVLVIPEKSQPLLAGSLTQVASLDFASLPSLDLIHQIVRNSNTVLIRITQTRKNLLCWHLYTAVSSNSLFYCTAKLCQHKPLLFHT